MANDIPATPAPPASYTGDPASSTKDRVRFLLGDIGPDFLMTDGEIGFLLGEANQNAHRAAIQACYALVARFSRYANETVGGISVQWTTLRDNFASLMDSLQTQQNRFASKGRAYLTGSSRSQMDAVASNPDRAAGQFRRQGSRFLLSDTYRSGLSPWGGDWDKVP